MQVCEPPFLNLWPLLDEMTTGFTLFGVITVSPWPKTVFGTVWPGIDLPALWFALVAVSLKLGGGTLAAVRLPAALFGAATVLPFYGLVRGAWGRAAAIAGMFILAVSAADVHYSRTTLNNNALDIHVIPSKECVPAIRGFSSSAHRQRCPRTRNDAPS